MTRLDAADGDKDRIADVLRQLARKELLSDEQLAEIMELEKISLSTIADIIKETKTGQGLKFFTKKPRI